TLVMANNGWIPFELAAAMVLGENIGTTITANLAAIIGNVHAKRAAFAHFIFNVFGVLWIIILISPVLYLINAYMVSSGQESPYLVAASIPIGLSLFHTSFNIVNTLLLIGFVPFIAKVATRVIKSTGDDEFKLEYISTGMMNTAELSIEEARKETVRLGDVTVKMSKTFRSLLEATKPKKQKAFLKKIKNQEEITDRMEQEISKYLMDVSASGTLSTDGTKNVTMLLSAVNDLERIGDIFYQMSKDVDRSIKNETSFTGKQLNNLNEMMDMIDKALSIMLGNLSGRRGAESLEPAVEVEAKINKMRNKFRKELMKEMDNNSFDPKRDGWYKDLIHLCEKVGDHVINVSEALTGELERDLRDAD
ncbi:MAG: PhoU domain-containing protein, partial [Cyclobacteriaceae bacterium]